MAIKCCKNCVPPKRHLACHDTCEEYRAEKEEERKKREWEKKNRPPNINNFDFDFNSSYRGKGSKPIKRD